jgi:hypothetical protein
MCSFLRLRGDTRCYKVLPITFYIKCLLHVDFELDFKWDDDGILEWRLQADRARGEEASCISCYMKDNPGSTEEDALNHINAMINDIIRELNWEFLKPDSNIPMKIICFNQINIYRKCVTFQLILSIIVIQIIISNFNKHFLLILINIFSFKYS